MSETKPASLDSSTDVESALSGQHVAAEDAGSRQHYFTSTQPPTANPAPLGLAAFALTTYVLSAHNAGWAPGLVWIGLAFFYGGLAQFAAGMWEFKKDNTFGATAFTTYGAFWMGLGFFVLLTLIPDLIPKTLHVPEALGWFLSGFFIFDFYMAVIALMLSKVIFTVFALLAVTFLTLFIGNYNNDAPGHGWTRVGGYFGIFTATAAFYASAAVCFNEVAKREVIWLGKPLLTLKRAPSTKKDVHSFPK